MRGTLDGPLLAGKRHYGTGAYQRYRQLAFCLLDDL
jgi:hypothetical protein